MARTPESNEQWLDHYQRLYERAEENYQSTGESKYDNARYKYQCIVTAFEALLKKEGGKAADLAKRQQNCRAVVENLYKDSYRKAEVEKLLNDAVWW